MKKLESILMNENILESIYDNLGYLFNLIPELKDMVGFSHKHPHHHLNVWNHTLYALIMAPMDYEVRLALLLHDVGKPHCYIEGDIRHYHGHPTVSKEITFKILNRLGYDEVFINRLCYLVEYHDMPIGLSQVKMNKDLLYKRYLVQYCDTYAHNPLKLEKRIKYLNKVKNYFD